MSRVAERLQAVSWFLPIGGTIVAHLAQPDNAPSSFRPPCVGSTDRKRKVALRLALRRKRLALPAPARGVGDSAGPVLRALKGNEFVNGAESRGVVTDNAQLCTAR